MQPASKTLHDCHGFCLLLEFLSGAGRDEARMLAGSALILGRFVEVKATSRGTLLLFVEVKATSRGTLLLAAHLRILRCLLLAAHLRVDLLRVQHLVLVG